MRRREYNIKTDQIGCRGVDRIQLAVVTVVMKGGKFFYHRATVSFSGTRAACSLLIRMRSSYRALVREPEGKRPLGRPGCRREKMLKWILKKSDAAV